MPKKNSFFVNYDDFIFSTTKDFVEKSAEIFFFWLHIQ